MTHLKRLNALNKWRIKRKDGGKWIIRPSPGGHRMDISVPMGIILRDMLGYAGNMREARTILNARKVLVNGMAMTSSNYPAGLMDVVEITDMKECYIVTLDKKGKIILEKIEKPKYRLCRVEDKKVLRGGKVQLNLWGGENILVGKDDYKTGDVVKLGLADRKIQGKIELKKGALVFVTGGKHAGKKATMESINDKIRPKEVVLKSGKDEFRTRLGNIYAIEK